MPSISSLSVGRVKKRTYTFADPQNPFTLESGSSIDSVTIAYETCGVLNEQKDNAILITHALTGDSHVAGRYGKDDAKPGWWEYMVGPGRGIDTDQYYVICSNVIGGCKGSTGPSSLNPVTGVSYGSSFPAIAISDMVNAQKRLIDHLGIKKLFSVIGGSVGGMQVLGWCSAYPGMVGSAVVLASTLRHSPLNIALNEVARQAIRSDPNWAGGDYYNSTPPNIGLSLARMVGHISYLSDEAMHLKFGREIAHHSHSRDGMQSMFTVESYLHYQGEKFIERFDANSLMCITQAADRFDVANRLAHAVKNQESVTSRYLVVSFSSDWLYPTYQSRELVNILKRSGCDVSFCEITASGGHDSFLLENNRLTRIINGFLSGSRSINHQGTKKNLPCTKSRGKNIAA